LKRLLSKRRLLLKKHRSLKKHRPLKKRLLLTLLLKKHRLLTLLRLPLPSNSGFGNEKPAFGPVFFRLRFCCSGTCVI
jgi:hypothetical protein